MKNSKIKSLKAEANIEYNWRRKEIEFFESQIKHIPRMSKGIAEKDIFRKALVVILYSHFEGYCKFMFHLYINAINNEGLKCRNVNYPIAAATLELVFKDLINPKKSGRIFKRVLSIEDNLHSFARRADFLEELEGFMDKNISIPDAAIDLESNLKPIVLKKNLYKLGLPHTLFDSLESEISQLLTARNGIAHGTFSQGVPPIRYKALRAACFTIMKTLKVNVIGSLVNKDYIKPN